MADLNAVGELMKIVTKLIDANKLSIKVQIIQNTNLIIECKLYTRYSH